MALSRARTGLAPAHGKVPRIRQPFEKVGAKTVGIGKDFRLAAGQRVGTTRTARHARKMPGAPTTRYQLRNALDCTGEALTAIIRNNEPVPRVISTTKYLQR